MSAAGLPGSIEAEALRLWGDPTGRTRREWRWRTHGSLALVISGPKRGLWCDHESGQGGRLGHRETHCFGRDAIEGSKRRTRGTATYAVRLIADSQPITGTLAERYVREVRGLGDVSLPSELRFHPAVWSPETGSKHPALIVPCRDSDDRVARVQAVLLDPETGGKASVTSPKLTFGAGASHVPASFAGREVSTRVDTLDFTLLTEGPEDAITLQAVTGWRADASLGAGSLGKPLYAAGTDLILFGDNGATGHAPAEAAAEAHRSRGVNVWLVFPPEGVKDANELLRQDGPDAVRACIDAVLAVDPPPARPNTDMGELRVTIAAAVDGWTAGNGPQHLLLSTATGSGKGEIPMQRLGHLANDRRTARRRFIEDWRRDHPSAPAGDAADAARETGIRPLRVAYVGPDHGLVARHVAHARSLGMIAAHDAGVDRNFDPADPASPARCTQPERVKQTRLAGEPMKLAACGIDLNGPHCPDRAGCRMWQAFDACAHAEFVGMVADRSTSRYLPSELRGFDFVLVDEPPDRVFFTDSDVELDLLDRHLFEHHPVRGDDGPADPIATEEAQSMYATVRAVLDASPNGYWPIEAMRAAGCDAEFFDRLVLLTDRRDHSTGMTASTPDDERASMARTSFRRSARKLCGLFRMGAAIMRGEDGTGRIELAGEASRIAIVRRVAPLHPSMTDARVMVTGAGLERASVQRWLPGVVEIGGGIPRAPHQTIVHFHKGMGKRAMRSEARRRWAQSMVALYGDDSRPDATGVITHAAHEHSFADLPGVITGHYGAVAGRNDWKRCSTFFSFGLRSLSPVDAAAAGACRTGEPVPIKLPARLMRRVAMRDGGSASVPTLEYEHPAAQEAQRAVREFDAVQGPLGRPRGANRTAADPVLLFHVATTPLPGAEVDVLICSAEQYAPDRMVMMLAEGLAVESSLDRNRVHPAIYEQTWTGHNDKRLEAGGFVVTALRVLSPPWRSGPRETWVVGRYWPQGRGRRTAGRLFVSTLRQLELNMMVLRSRCGADRFDIEREVRPHEVTINPQRSGEDAFIVTSPETGSPWSAEHRFGDVGTSRRVEHPPDG